MSTVLGNISRDNTRFTIFENDQVLTADQLNDLFNYLDVQTRLTRTRAIGVGIICGLEIGTLENMNIVVSKGAAITTDGDLLHIDEAREFDQYELFEDVNAKYPYFRVENEMIPVFELRNSKAPGVIPGKELSAFEEVTVTAFKDYVGVLYLEDYKNDPDVCTGTDCDNKGAEAAKELKVLLVHKNSMRLLLQSIPAINKNYFALDDLNIPRVSVKNTIDTYAELNAAFNNALVVKEDIKSKLTKAYQQCKPIIEDEFDGSDPTTNWGSLIDQHFNVATSIYGQYVYDFARDISFAYNEMRETLFADNMMCCPDVNLFPKHVLMGLVKTATASRIPETTDRPPIIRPVVVRPFDINLLGLTTFKPRFDIGLLKRRFHPIHIDTEYRHHFYESPVLNNKEENILQTRFCFTRINSLIKNFKVPTAQDLQNLENLKVTPGYFEDKPLGERSIPFYYRFDSNLPVNLYWNYKANVRKKEDEILYYSAAQYPSSTPATLTPLQFNILPYNFFRVEGHIGFKHQEAENALNRLIQENNLPFNVLTVQVERNPRTIPRKNWHFPEINLYSGILRNNFFDQMNQVDLVHAQLKAQPDLPDAANINLSIDNYSNAKSKVLTNQPVTQPEFNINAFKADVQSVINATADVKVKTKKFDFAQTSIPHDFVINTNVMVNADLIADLILQKETKKIEDLMLGNFMKINPGLEHAGGVLRGGTFVLVYTSNDDVVVADFMLPYYVPDKDIVPNPPVIKPLPPIATPKIDLPKIFKKVPLYFEDIDLKIKEKTDPLDLKFDAKINERFAGFDTKFTEFNQKEAALSTKFNLYDTILLGKVTNPVRVGVGDVAVPKGVDIVPGIAVTAPGIREEEVTAPITTTNPILTTPIATVPITVGVGTSVPVGVGTTGIVTTIPSGIGVVINRAITSKITAFNNRQTQLEKLSAKAPDRKEKEAALLKAAENLTKELNKPGIVADPNNELLVKSLLSDIHTGNSLISTKDLAPQADKLTKLANKINNGFGNKK